MGESIFSRCSITICTVLPTKTKPTKLRHELYFLPWHSHIQFVTNRLRVPILTISVVQNWKQLQAGLWAIDVTRKTAGWLCNSGNVCVSGTCNMIAFKLGYCSA